MTQRSGPQVDQYGVQYADGSVEHPWNGPTQLARAIERSRHLHRTYPREKFTVVRRRPAGSWQPVYSRREYLLARAVLADAPILLAIEAVSSVAIEHPEWDMNEYRTWVEWAEQT